MDPTPPTESAVASQVQLLTHDQRVTNFLRWFTTACTAVGTATVLWIATQFMQTRDNQLRLGIIVENLSARVARVEDDNDKEKADYQKVLERQQMQHLAIQQIQGQLGLR